MKEQRPVQNDSRAHQEPPLITAHPNAGDYKKRSPLGYTPYRMADLTSRDPTSRLIARMASLADATRIRILHLVADQALLVSDLADVLQMPQSTVSRHLKQLVDQGWLVSHREGTSHQYRMLVPELDAPAQALWEITRQQTLDQPAVAQDRLRLAAVRAARQRDSRSFFAGAARDWDRLRSELFGHQFSTDALLSLLDSSLIVADLGCGTGAIVHTLAPHVARVIGVDNSEEMLLAARQRLSALPNVALEQADLVRLPLADASVDAALMILSLAYVSDVPAALAEARRVLKPAGRLLVLDALTHDRDDFRRLMGQSRMGFDADALTTQAKSAGFTRVITHVQHPEPPARGPALLRLNAR